MADQLSLEQIARIAHAKNAELETWVKPRLGGPGTTDLDWLVADVALLFGLFADVVDREVQHG